MHVIEEMPGHIYVRFPSNRSSVSPQINTPLS